MVNIHLIDKWSLQSDRHNWMLVRESGQRSFIEGYYSSLESALESFVEMKIRLSSARNVHTLLIYKKRLLAVLNEALLPLKVKILDFKVLPISELPQDPPINELKGGDNNANQ